MATIIFQTGEEYKVKIENSDEFSDSFFNNIYARASTNIKNIVDNRKKITKEENNNIFYKEKSKYNNIIAFLGERGSGKTSSMLSFAKYLVEIKNERKIVFDDKMDAFINDLTFQDVGVIDPSLFEKNTNILEVIIANMFQNFQKKVDSNNANNSYDKKRDLLKKFQVVYESLKTIEEDKKNIFNGEIIEALSSLGSSSNLREHLKELVDEYLDFMLGKKDDKSFLLILIDDLDLNIEHADEMVEQIRKYFLLPNVVILMALKLEQLQHALEHEYIKNFDILLKNSSVNKEEPRKMASLYLQKLIPNDKRLHLPEIINLRKDLDIKIGDKDKEQIEDSILGLIYKKTGLLFLKYDYELHPIIPRNLRGFHNLVALLSALDDLDIIDKKYSFMEDGAKNENISRAKKNNFNVFLEYFYSDWIRNNLSLEDQNIINDFLKTDIRQKNKLIINRLFNLIDDKSMEFIKNSKKAKNPISFEEEFKHVTNRLNNSINMSIGDVLFILNLLNNLSDSYKNLTFAIKTLYSITLYEIVSFEKNFKSLQIVLGGSFYNLDTILIRREENSYRRDVFEFSYKNLVDSHNINEMINNLRKGSFASDELKKFRLFELLQYFLLYSGVRGYDYREVEDKAYYDKDPNLGRGNILLRVHTFDVLGFLFFVYNPKRILERMISDKNTLEKIFEKKDSKDEFLYSKIEEWRDKYYNVFPIYSIEFIESILHYLADTYDKQKKKSNSNNEKQNSIENNEDDYENNKGNYYFYLEDFISRMKDSIEKISNNNNKYIKDNVFKAFNNCPIVSIISDENKDYKPFFDDFNTVKHLFEDVYNNNNNLLKSKGDTSGIFGESNISNEEKIKRIKFSITKAKKTKGQAKKAITVKNCIDNIIKNLEVLENKKLIIDLNNLNDKIDQNNEFEKGKSKTLEKIIDILENELKKFRK